MIAVANRVRQQRLRVRAAVLLIKGVAVAQRFQSVLDFVGHRALGDEPARDVAAALHQIGVIHLLKGSGLLEQRLDDCAVRVVDQNHDVR